MGAETENYIRWSDIHRHNTQEDCWLVLEGHVYDVTRWAQYHPGGQQILSYHAGRDATEFFNAFHKDKTFAKKYLKTLYVGEVENYTQSELIKDFAQLTETAKKMGLFIPSFTFYALMLLHVFLLEITAYLVVLVFGTWWLPFGVSVVIQSIYMMQASWLQHDFGHGSPCKSRFWRRVLHYITGSLIMGFSPKWWNDLHFRHHAKPNVITKDPDLNLGPFYVQGNVMAKEAARDWKNPLPFHLQHIYFFATGPPILMSILMQLSCCVFMVVNKCWLDIVLGSCFFLCYYLLYVPFLGLRWTLIMCACMRCIQSHWFTFVALSNHVPMPISHDETRSWFQHQVESTSNIKPSIFNHWFTGGLNTHIEHHLFPTMPRHNLHKIRPCVKELCEKYHITYTEKSMFQAVSDVIRSLKSYGAMWKKTKEELHIR